MPSIPGAGRRQRNIKETMHHQGRASATLSPFQSFTLALSRSHLIGHHAATSRAFSIRGDARSQRGDEAGTAHCTFLARVGRAFRPAPSLARHPSSQALGTHFAWNVPHKHIHPFFITDCWCADEGGVLLSIVLMQRNSMAHLGWTSTYSTSSKQSISKKSDRR